LDIGNSSQLTVKFDPDDTVNKSVSWSSSFSSVVSVSSGGLVTAKSPGTAVITAKATGSGNGTATCIVTVKAPPLELDYETLSMRIGDTKTLNASFTSVAPANARINWSSSDSSVAVVSTTGTVTAKKSGTAIITATAASGGAVAKCTVNVASVSISLSKSRLTLNPGSTADLSVDFNPKDMKNQSAIYSVDNGFVASVSSAGRITAKAPGTAIVTVKSAVGGAVATCIVTVSTPTLQETVESQKENNTDVYVYDYASNTEVSTLELDTGSNTISVIFNGQALSFALPILNVNGRTFYPMRELLEAIGAEVGWIEETRTATGSINSSRVEFTIGSETYLNNTVEKFMDTGVYPFISDSRTYIPIRYACESLGYIVDWDDSTRTINLISKVPESL